MLEEEEKEMSFLDHLEELRWHIVRSVIAVLVVTVWAFLNKGLIFDTIILGPARPNFLSYRVLCKLGQRLNLPDLCIEKVDFIIQNRTMTGQFTTHIMISFITGFIVAFPYIFWEIWRFIMPGLHTTERRMTRGAVLFVTGLFAIGTFFGYFILSPLTINFLAGYQVSELNAVGNFIDLSDYISTLTFMVLACAIMFQLPAVVLVATKAGLINAQLMRKFRKHSFIVILIIAAILTPSPDVFSQMILAIPLYILYELSIFMAASAGKAAALRAKAEALEEAM